MVISLNVQNALTHWRTADYGSQKHKRWKTEPEQIVSRAEFEFEEAGQQCAADSLRHHVMYSTTQRQLTTALSPD